MIASICTTGQLDITKSSKIKETGTSLRDVNQNTGAPQRTNRGLANSLFGRITISSPSRKEQASIGHVAL